MGRPIKIIKLIKQAAYSHGEYQVFNDWLEMAAISISNQFDPTHREEREKRYLDVINSYEKREQQLFPEMFAHLVAALQEKAETTGAEDILGLIFHELELHNEEPREKGWHVLIFARFLAQKSVPFSPRFLRRKFRERKSLKIWETVQDIANSV